MNYSNLSDEELLKMTSGNNNQQNLSSMSDDELLKMVNKPQQKAVSTPAINNTPKPKKQRTEYTYPNQPVKNMDPETFKSNVDSLYNIPQVPMPTVGDIVSNTNGNNQPLRPNANGILEGGVISNVISNANNAIQEMYNNTKANYYKPQTAWQMKANEAIKQQALNNIARRKIWEERHPFISDFQKDFQPNYNSNLKDWELKAKYGAVAPIGEDLKTEIAKVRGNIAPSLNIVLGALTGGENFVEGGLTKILPNLAKNPKLLKALSLPIEGAGWGGLDYLARKASGIETDGTIGDYAKGGAMMLPAMYGGGKVAGKVLKSVANKGVEKGAFDAMKELSNKGTYNNKSLEEIAPKTYAKQQAKKQEVKNWDIDALPHIKEEKTPPPTVEEIIAPKTMKKKAQNQIAQVGDMVDVENKIAELEKKAKSLGGEKTKLGQKYLKQAEELRTNNSENLKTPNDEVLDKATKDKIVTMQLEQERDLRLQEQERKIAEERKKKIEENKQIEKEKVKKYEESRNKDQELAQNETLDEYLKRHEIKSKNGYDYELRKYDWEQAQGLKVSDQVPQLKETVAEEKVPQLKPEETQDNFKQRIWETPIEKYKPTKKVIDWGKQKRQGKRSNRMVTGAMGDISLQGKKEYSNILGAFSEDIQKDVRSYVGADNIQQMAYVKARENGFSHEQSIDFAVTFGDKENLLYKKLNNKTQEATISKTETVKPIPKKGTYENAKGITKEFEYYDEVPEGFVKETQPTNVPYGYTQYTNNKSLFSGERKQVLVKNKSTSEVISKVEKAPMVDKVENNKEFSAKKWFEEHEEGIEHTVTKDELSALKQHRNDLKNKILDYKVEETPIEVAKNKSKKGFKTTITDDPLSYDLKQFERTHNRCIQDIKNLANSKELDYSEEKFKNILDNYDKAFKNLEGLEGVGVKESELFSNAIRDLDDYYSYNRKLSKVKVDNKKTKLDNTNKGVINERGNQEHNGILYEADRGSSREVSELSKSKEQGTNRENLVSERKNQQERILDGEINGSDSESFGKIVKETVEKIKDYNAIKNGIKKGTTVEEFFKNNNLSEIFKDKIEGIENYNIIAMPNRIKTPTIRGKHVSALKTVMLNMDAIGNNKEQFVNTLMHELEHAKQELKYQNILKKSSKTVEDRAFMRAYRECRKVNENKARFYDKHKELLDNTLKNKLNMSQSEYEDYFFNKCSKLEQKTILEYANLYDKYLKAEHEVQAREAGLEAVRRIKNGYRQNGQEGSFETTTTTRGLRRERNVRAGSQSSVKETKTRGTDRESNIDIDLRPQGEQPTKERGAIKTLNKYDKEMADAVTDREYEVRSLNKVADEVHNMSEKELDNILNSDRSSDTKSLALAESIKSSINNGEVPINKLNKWASEGTEIGQAMQARRAIAPETAEEAIIRMHNNYNQKIPNSARELLNDSEKIVNELKKTNEEINKEFEEWLNREPKAKKELSVEGDRLALLKAMEKHRNSKNKKLNKELERYEERKRKIVEKLVGEKTLGMNPKRKADIIDNIMKLDENGGLTSDNVCKLINKMYGIKEVTPADVKALKELSNKIQNAKTEREKDLAKAFMQKYVVDNSLGTSAWEKLNALRYINMLGSLKSRLLDFGSTTVYQTVRLGDNAVALVLDKASSKIFGTESVYNGLYAKEWGKGFVQGAKEGLYDVVHGINSGRAGETARYDLNKPMAFRYKPLKDIKGFPKFKQAGENAMSVVEKMVNGMIKIPDRAFFQARYNASLIDQLEARGIKTEKYRKLKGEQLSETITNIADQKEIEQAILEARENVFQRDCIATKFSRDIRNAFNKAQVGDFKVGDFIFPFVHTTSAIAQDVVERIGAGYFKGFSQLRKISKNGGSKAELRDAYNSIAKSIVGSAIITLGAVAKSLNPKDDLDETYIDKEVSGKHNKSVNIGNVSLNAKDVPQILVLSNLGKRLASNDEHKIRKTIEETFEAVAELHPIISKYQEETKKTNYKKDDDADTLNEFIANAIGVPVAQFTQNAELRNVREAIDPYERETFVPEHPYKTQINRFKNATPLLSESLPKKYNAIGKPVTKNNIDDPVERVISSLVTGHKRIKEDETYSTYKDFGEKFKKTDFKGKNSIAMAKIKRGISVNGANYKMTNEEFSNFQRDYGRINHNIRQNLLKNPNFMSSDAEEFAKYINEVKSSAEEAVKIKQLGHIPNKYKNGNWKVHKYTEQILKDYDKLTQ